MAQTGYKKFLNRRKWQTDLTTSHSAPTYPDTYLSGTHSFKFDTFLEKGATISFFLDPDGSTSLTASYVISYAYTGSVKSHKFNVGGISPGYYNFRIKMETATASYQFNADYLGGSFEPNSQLSGQGPYFEPVFDTSNCTQSSLIQLATPILQIINYPTYLSIQWNQIISASNFELEKGTDGVTWPEIFQIDPNRFSYDDFEFSPGVTYHYRLRAMGDNIYYQNSNYTQSSTVPPNKQLSAPKLTVGELNTTSIQLNWFDVDNEIWYVLSRSNSFNGVYATAATFSANTTSYRDAGLSSNTTYFYKIQSKGDGVIYLDSDLGSIVVQTL